MASTFISFWLRLKAKQPALNDSRATVTLTADQFEKQLRQAYEAGTKDTAAVARELRGQADSRDDAVSEFMRIMGM